MDESDNLARAYFEACGSGDLDALAELLDDDPTLVDRRDADGATCLHRAARHPDALRLLLRRGADPNARDVGDNALALHFAAAGGPVEAVRALLDGGSDVHGAGDAHALDVIGWATCFEEARHDVVEVLTERGALHHVFSAVAMGDPDLVRQVAVRDPEALARRLSAHEQEQSALHYVVAPPDGLVGGRFRTGEHYALLELLIELQADIEARDAKGRTPLELAMLMGDDRAMRILHRAGATVPDPVSASEATPATARRVSPMVSVMDVAASVAWYRSIGFRLAGQYSEGDHLDWAAVCLGDAEVMLVPSGTAGSASHVGLSLWFYTDGIEELYRDLKSRQFRHARAILEGGAVDGFAVPFTTDLHEAFYGGREFGVRDPDGVELRFAEVEGA